MAIVLDTTTTSINTGQKTNPSYSWSHTVTGSNPLLVVAVSYSWASGVTGCSVSSLTYNDVALTQVGSYEMHASTSGGRAVCELWYLKAPATGGNTLAIAWGGGTGVCFAPKVAVTSFTGVNQAAPLDASNHGGGKTANPQASLTTGSANALVFTSLGWTDTSKTATSDRTSLSNDRTGGDSGEASSYQLATTTGSYTDTYTLAASVYMSDSWIIASFAPYAETTSTSSSSSTSTTSSSTSTSTSSTTSTSTSSTSTSTRTSTSSTSSSTTSSSTSTSTSSSTSSTSSSTSTSMSTSSTSFSTSTTLPPTIERAAPPQVGKTTVHFGKPSQFLGRPPRPQPIILMDDLVCLMDDTVITMGARYTSVSPPSVTQPKLKVRIK